MPRTARYQGPKWTGARCRVGWNGTLSRMNRPAGEAEKKKKRKEKQCSSLQVAHVGNQTHPTHPPNVVRRYPRAPGGGGWIAQCSSFPFRRAQQLSVSSVGRSVSPSTCLKLEPTDGRALCTHFPHFPHSTCGRLCPSQHWIIIRVHHGAYIAASCQCGF